MVCGRSHTSQRGFVRPDERITLGFSNVLIKMKRGTINTCKLAVMQRGERERFIIVRVVS